MSQPSTSPIDIRPVTEADLPALEQHLHRGFPQRHHPRVALQAAGKASYLIAWLGDVPVGHMVIEWAWEHPHEDAMASLLRGQAVLFDLYVVDAHRSRGIGSQFLRAADQLAQTWGRPLIGLGVAIDNPRSHALYERHGYQDAGIGEFTSGWYELDEHGEQQWFEEREVCMIKRYELPDRSGM